MTSQTHIKSVLVDVEIGRSLQQKPPWWVVQYRIRNSRLAWNTVRIKQNGPPQIWLTRKRAEELSFAFKVCPDVARLDREYEKRVVRITIDFPDQPIRRHTVLTTKLETMVNGRTVTWQCEGSQEGSESGTLIPCSYNATVRDSRGDQWCEKCRLK